MSRRETNEPRDHEIEATSITSRPIAAGAALEPVRPDHEREADEPDRGGEHGRAGDALAGDEAPDDDLQRHRARDHRGDARVDPRLGDVNQPDAEREQRNAQPRGRDDLAPRGAKRAPERARGCPRARAAAARNLVPAVSSGGSVRTASLIARYVEPQTR